MSTDGTPAQHFNQLTPAQAERLAMLIEECAEVQHVACKVLRHGYESRDPTVLDGPTNRELLEREVGDLEATVTRMVEREDMHNLMILVASEKRRKEAGKYMHHQEDER